MNDEQFDPEKMAEEALRLAEQSEQEELARSAIPGGARSAVREAARPNGRSRHNKALVLVERMALGFPDMANNGSIRNTCNNIRHAISKMGLRCEYDEFHDKLLIGGQSIGEYAGELSDHTCLVVRRMIEEHYEFDPGREKMFDAAVQLCLEHRFDPIVDYLDSLKWDGVNRVDRWLTTYLGAADTALNQAIGRIALVAQVRRAKQPGCKFDQIITLEGPEGGLKSSALAVLAGGSENFSDQTILGKDDKEQQELLRGVWVYEIADLSNIRKAEVEHVKAFASRTHDRARPAYGRTVINLPRRGVIWASTNNSGYLKSQTGNRRFWPFAVGRIDIEGLKRDRNQLFAEAVKLEAFGMPITLPEELWGAAAEQQERRREVDPWEDALREVRGTLVGGERRVFTRELLEINLSIPKERQHNQHTKRVADCMRILGWDGPDVIRIGEERLRGFTRKENGGGDYG
jgi:predicted P-loop ATPase